jgi:hypothetical protein
LGDPTALPAGQYPFEKTGAYRFFGVVTASKKKN